MVLALVAGAGLVAIAIVNLAHPESRGPADQGDFTRIVPAFSSGPVGFALWPDAGDPTRAQRFGAYHHRFWRLDGGVPWGSQPSSSKLVFLPERLLRAPWWPPLYDLTRNSMAVVAALGLGLAAAVYAMRSIAPALSLVVIGLLLGDLQVSWYVNSFFQEAGTWVFLFAAVCLLFAWQARRSQLVLVLAFVALGLLATTKPAYAPSVLVLAAGLVVLVVACAATRREAWLAMLCGVVVLLVTVAWVERVRRDFGRDVVYHVVFSTVLPELPPARQERYLSELGLPSELARLAGTNAYDGAITPAERELLGNQLHLRALGALARTEPRLLLRLLVGAVGATGDYDLRRAGYGYRTMDAPVVESPRVDLWSRLRATLLHDWRAYALVVLALAVAVRPRRVRDDTGWTFFFVLLASSFVVASLLQVVIAILGNGHVDLLKHLYLANVCCDVALVLAFGAVAQSCARRASTCGSERGSPAHR